MPEEYFEVRRPDEQTTPIVVDVPHAGEWIPDRAHDEMAIGDRALKRDLDLYVDKFWQDAPDLGATMLVSRVSRYVVDLNRAPDDVSPEAVEGGERVDAPGYYQDRGVVWRTTTAGTPVMDGPLSSEAFERRLDTFYHPYHRALRQAIDRVRDQYGYCILVDGHSMPSRGRQKHSDTGRRRADIVPGDLEGTSCSRMIRWSVEQHYREANYTVTPNDPYQGGWITRHYGEPDEDVHAIQIEVNRDLYMNEETFEIDPEGLERLRSTCASLIGRLSKIDLT